MEKNNLNSAVSGAFPGAVVLYVTRDIPLL